MSRLDPSKAAEADRELKEGIKHVTTSMLKWKPDWLAAEPCFQRAGRAFKQAGLLDSAVAAWRRAADAAHKLGNLKQAAVTLEAASREMAMAKDVAGKTEACKLMSECAALLVEAGEPVRASDMKLKAAKLAEGFDRELAVRLVDEVIEIFDGDDDKDVYAVDPLRKAMQTQMALGKHASAMRSMDKLFKIWTRLDQKHNLYKLVLSRVVLLLAAADPVAAQAEFDRHLDLPGFAPTDEAAAAEDMIGAYTEQDGETMRKVLERNVFGYLDHAITVVARKLPAGLETGAAVGGAKEGESASAAVAAAPVRQPGEFRQLGGSVDWAQAGGGRAAACASAGGGAADDSVAQARKKADKDFAARASLFARPAGAGASAGAGAGAAAAAGAGAAGGGSGAAADGDDAFAAAGAEEDYAAAFATMDFGPDGLPVKAGGGGGGASNAAAASAAAQEPEEDLGLL